MKLSVALLNAVTDDPFPIDTDTYDDFVLGTPEQTFKVSVTLTCLSSMTWPAASTHVRVSGRVDEELNMYSKYIEREDIAALDEDSVVQVILDGLREDSVSYSDRHRPSFSKAVVHQHTDPKAWTSQAGTVDIRVEAVKLVRRDVLSPQSRRKLKAESSKTAVVKHGEQCKYWQCPALRVVPSVSVCHSEGAPDLKLEDGQQDKTGEGEGAKVSESDIVTPLPAQQCVSSSVSLAYYTVKYDSAEHVSLRRIHAQSSLAAGSQVAGEHQKRPRSNVKQKRPAKKGYKEVPCSV